MPSRTSRTLRVRSLLLALALAAAGTLAGGESGHGQTLLGVDPLDRVQLHRNSNRGVPYLPLARSGQSPGAPSLAMRPLLTVELDGDPLENVYSNVRPLDVDGDGAFEFVQYNGFRFMQVWSAAGQKLWRIEDPDGRLHDYVDATQRDPIVVMDLDGDGRQDIAHCWLVNGQRALVYRRGLDGAVLRSVPLQGSATSECQMGAFWFAGVPRPVVLVGHAIWGTAAAACPRNWIGYWARTVAFDLEGRKLWERNTCDAGHYAWPLDADWDGQAEAVFVGKYLLRADGSLQCSLNTWPADDHVDSLAVADLDPMRPGLEAVAVGATGLALFDAATCAQIWRIPTSVVRNPQHVAIAKLDDTAAAPQIVVEERGSVSNPKLYVVSAQGTVLAANPNFLMAMQNANLDGALGLDEALGSWGQVVDRFGNLRLSKWWYWGLKGTKVVETNTGPYPNSFDRWQAFPVAYDHDGDGKDELLTWGQSLLVVGKVR